MTDYPVECDRFQSFPSGGGLGLSVPGSIGVWQNDGDPATTLALPHTTGGTFDWEFSGDQTAHASEVVGFRVEVDVASASVGTFEWGFYFYGAGDLIYRGTIPFSGTGTVAGVSGLPEVDTTGGVDRMAYALDAIAGLNAAGELLFVDPPGDGTVVISEVRVLFYAGTTVTVLRQYPRDDQYGFGGVARTYPPPRRGRNYGQQP